MLRRELRPEARPPSLRFRGPNIHVPLWLLACGWLLVGCWRMLRWLAVHPRCTVVAAVAAALVWTDTVLPAGVVLALALSAALGWWAVDPATFTALVGVRVQLWLREWFTYRRDWQPAMLTSGLTLRESWGGDLPTLRRVRSDGRQDVLRVRMLPGQTPETWKAASAQLAQTFSARQVRVRRVAGRAQELDLLVTLRSRSSLVASRNQTSSNVTVTEGQVDVDSDQQPAARGAFPRTPRRGAA